MYMIIASRFNILLPERQTAAEEVFRNPREYSVGVIVKKVLLHFAASLFTRKGVGGGTLVLSD